jgi:hypothetical protein
MARIVNLGRLTARIVNLGGLTARIVNLGRLTARRGAYRGIRIQENMKGI